MSDYVPPEAFEALGSLPEGVHLQPVIDAAKSALDLENTRVERFDSKARGQMTLAGSWFAVAQAVAAVALRADTPSGWVIAIAAAAAGAGIALFLAMRESAKVWKLRPQPAITQETLEDMTVAAKRDPATFAEQLIQQYRHLLGHAQESNEKRADQLDAATAWWWVALGLAFVEMTIALLSRIFGA